MYKFSFIINKGEHAGERHTYSVKGKNYDDARLNAIAWCDVNNTFKTITRIN